MGQYLPSLVVPPIVARLRHETESLILPGEDADLRRYLAERRRRRHPAQPQPARRGHPGRGRGRAPPRGLPRAAGPRRRRVHLGQGLLGVQPDRPRRVPRHGGAREGAAAHALPPGAAPSLPAPGRPRHAEVRQPRHGGVPRPRPDRRRVPRGARRAGVPGAAAPASCCRPTCPTRTACSGRSPRWAIARGARAAARRSSCASSRAPTWPWSGSRPRCTAGRRRPTRAKAEVDANYKRMLEYGCRPEHAARRAPRRRQPQPLRRGLRLVLRARRRASSAGSSSRCSRAWPTTRRARCSARAGGLLLYAPVVRAGGLPQRHRLPRAPPRREHRARELPAPRVRPRAGLARLDARARPLPRPRSPRRPGRDAPRRTQDRAAETGARPIAHARGRHVRQRARHRLVAARQPRLDRRVAGRLARAAAGDDAARRSRGELIRGAAQATAAIRRARTRRLSLRARRPRAVDRALDAAPAGAAGVGGATADERARAPRRVRRRARPAARRPDRRDDRRRRQDGGRGGRRGLRGDRLRALLRARPRRERRGGRRPHASRSAWWW